MEHSKLLLLGIVPARCSEENTENLRGARRRPRHNEAIIRGAAQQAISVTEYAASLTPEK